MSKLIFGSARIDERGRASGGVAGDQTGYEVSTQAGYIHTKGWRVFRAKKFATRQKLAFAMASACANQNIGYDQYNRDSLYNAVKGVNFNPALCTKPVETDCSALVRVCCAYAGIRLQDFNTSSEPDVLKSCGHFDEVVNWTLASLEAGDILVTKVKGHTVIVVQDMKTTYQGIANQVYAGYWRNGDARKKALKEAGWNVAEVQKIVNQLAAATGS